MTVSLLEFPVVPLTDIPARLRLLAEQIEDGDLGDVRSLTVLAETDDTLTTMAFGHNWDAIRAQGLLFNAAVNLAVGGE